LAIGDHSIWCDVFGGCIDSGFSMMGSKPQNIEDFTGEWKPSGTQRNYKTCPVCGNNTWHLYVDPTTGRWMCFAGEHGAGGQVQVEPSAAHLRALLERPAPVKWPEIDLPEYNKLSSAAINYICERGFEYGVLESKYGIRQTGLRLLIPYFDKIGRLIYWNKRKFAEGYDQFHEKTYVAAPGRHPLYVPFYGGAPFVIVEGCFDAIRCAEAGCYAVALGGKSLPKYLMQDLLRLSEPFECVYIMLDGDAMSASLKLRNQLSPYKRSIVVVLPDGTDPADHSEQQIQALLEASP